MFLYMTSVVYCRTFLHFISSSFNNLKKTNSENVSTPKVHRLCTQTQDLKFNMSQMNLKEASTTLPLIPFIHLINLVLCD